MDHQVRRREREARHDADAAARVARDRARRGLPERTKGYPDPKPGKHVCSGRYGECGVTHTSYETARKHAITLNSAGTDAAGNRYAFLPHHVDCKLLIRGADYPCDCREYPYRDRSAWVACWPRGMAEWSPELLAALWADVNYRPLRLARVWFPGRDDGYVRLTRDIANYAMNLATMKRCDADGNTRAAQIYRTIAASIREDIERAGGLPVTRHHRRHHRRQQA